MTRRHPVLLGAATTLALVLAACGGGSAAAITPPPGVDLSVTAQGDRFDRADLPLPADGAKVFFRNLDGVPHNVAIYRDETAAESLFIGETITDAATVYEVPALEPGTYAFRCDVHPNMKGTVSVAD